MNSFIRSIRLCCRFSALGLVTLLLWVGCHTSDQPPANPPAAAASGPPPAAVDKLRQNDLVTIRFTGIANPPPPHEERIKDDGTITPSSLFKAVKAEGLTPLQLERTLQEEYDRYFKNLRVTVMTEGRYIYVKGEVKNPGRFNYAGELTVLKALAIASDFTDFAKKKKVRLIRANGQTLIVNCIKALSVPSQNLPIYPGDTIEVPRRLW